MDEKQIKAAIASLAKETGKKEALAELLVEYIGANHLATDFISLLLDTRSLNPGDMLVKKLRKGIKVHTLVPGAIHLRNEITVTDRMNFVLDGAVVGAQANLWELEGGEIGTVDSIKTEMQAKLKDYYFGKVFNALASVWSVTNTPNNYTTVATAITAPVLKAAIDQINQTTGGVRAVIGTRAALTPVTTFGASWSNGSANLAVDDNIREIMSTGWLGTYYGAPLIGLAQEYDNPEDYTPLIPDDKILVIGNKVGEFITYGEVKTQEWVNNEPIPPYWNYQLYQQFGLIVDKAAGIHVIKIT